MACAVCMCMCICPYSTLVVVRFTAAKGQERGRGRGREERRGNDKTQDEKKAQWTRTQDHKNTKGEAERMNVAGAEAEQKTMRVVIHYITYTPSQTTSFIAGEGMKTYEIKNKGERGRVRKNVSRWIV
jgi:hypothetical protein